MIGTPQSSAEATAVYALLAIIADPKKAKARLDELEQIRIATEAAQEKHRLTLDDLRRTTEVHTNALLAGDKALAERKAEITNQQNALNVARSDLAAAEADFAARRIQFAKTSAEANAKLDELAEHHAKHESDLNTREQALKQLEERVSRDSRAAAAMLDEARAIKADYDRRTAALQAALRK